MKRKYPAKLFYWGILMNFLFHYVWLSLPGAVLCIIGLWTAPCLRIGAGLLVLDLVLSVTEQLRIRKAALTPSENPEFNALMEALTGPGGLEAFGKVLEEKISAAAPVEEDAREN